MQIYKGLLSKMHADYSQENSLVCYQFVMDGQKLFVLNDYVGKNMKIIFHKKIHCIHCGRKIAKTYSNGYCFPCFQKLPQCDICMIKPEKCHYHLGTCRDTAYAHAKCFQPHTLYLAKSSSIKVGITKAYSRLQRWMDQGAVEAMAIADFSSRKKVGEAEYFLSQTFNDKTNWRKMLKGDYSSVSIEETLEKIKEMTDKRPEISLFKNPQKYLFHYPVQKYPQKPASVPIEKIDFFEGILTGIKGQYLIFENKVLNIRKYSGFFMEFVFLS